ncbi:hypothetical protein [Streptomyces yerevanensis]|uniref:hypothetical protein n=1 Tax=Streptomyces yerevanensis TaxID=66378 RepID=UPI0012FEC825|nr:hypothetical protein [Streptomyces yerevanensis]
MDLERLDAYASEISSGGHSDVSGVLRELRTAGFSPVEAAYVTARVCGLTLAEVKAALFESDAWKDQHSTWNVLHERLEDQ